MTTALQCINSKKPYTLAGFKPVFFCSVGGRDGHYTTPPGQHWVILYFGKLFENFKSSTIFLV
jgi:hypothetical protein